MKPIEFEEQNTVFGEGQKEYLPLPAFLDDSPYGYVVSCWKLSIKERIQVLIYGRVWLSQMCFHKPLQPQLVTSDKYEIFNKPQKELSRSFKGACKGLCRGLQGALKKLFLLAFVFLTFVACKPENVSGYVVDMEYQPAHSESYYDITLKMPRARSIPDKYLIWIADRNRSRCIEVEKSFYKQLRKGQFVNLKR